MLKNPGETEALASRDEPVPPQSHGPKKHRSSPSGPPTRPHSHSSLWKTAHCLAVWGVTQGREAEREGNAICWALGLQSG